MNDEPPPPYPGKGDGGIPQYGQYPAQPGYPGYPQVYPPGGYAPQPGPPGGYPAPGPPGYQAPYLGAQPEGYPPAPNAGATTTVIIQGGSRPVFLDVPARMTCPHCQADITSGITYETGTFAWVMCLILCLVGCDAGCCLIPFCCDAAKDAKHYCPSCNQYLGTYRRM